MKLQRPDRLCRQFSKRFLQGLLLGVCLCLALSPAAAQPESPREHEVKAVFLFNFARFVEWPASQAATNENALLIGILGEDPFGSALDHAVQNETIRELPIVIRRAKRIEDLPPCHLLYINLKDLQKVQAILRSLAGRGVLTVGEGEGFTRAGGMIAFRTEQQRVRFLINLDVAEREGFHISSKLLKVADVTSTSK